MRRRTSAIVFQLIPCRFAPALLVLLRLGHLILNVLDLVHRGRHAGLWCFASQDRRGREGWQKAVGRSMWSCRLPWMVP